MIIKCPKCNFEQPQDEFCAQCGINILHYKPKPKPLSERITKNSLTYVFLLLICLFGTLYFVKQNWLSSASEIAVLQPASVSESSNIERVMASEAAQQQNQAVETENLETNKNLANPYVVVRVIAMPTSALSFFAEKVLNPNDLNELNLIKVNETAKEYLNQLDQMEHFFKTKYYANVFQKPLVIQQTVYDENIEDELGFLLNISIDSYKDGDLLLKVNLNKNFFAVVDASEPTWQKIEETISFTKEDTYMLYGIFPQRALNESEASLFSDGYLALMNQRAFQLSEITFAVIFTYKY